jgi:phage host-nuclease inhibitor protein Gam
LYRDPNADDVPEKVYQGDVSTDYQTVGDINRNRDGLETALMGKYSQMSRLYKEVIDLLKKEHIIDNDANTSIYVNAASKDMRTPFNTYYKSQVEQKYGEEVVLYDSVFFIPIIDRIFEMTKL